LTTGSLDGNDGSLDGNDGVMVDGVMVTKTVPLPTDETESKISSLLELQRSLLPLLQKPDYPTAIATSTLIIEKTLAMYPPTPSERAHVAVARAYNDMGYVYKSAGDYDKAIEAYHEAINLYKDSSGIAGKGYSGALGNVSICYREYASSIVRGVGDAQDSSVVEVEKMKSGLLARSREAAEAAVESVQMRIDKLTKALEDQFKQDEMDELNGTKDETGGMYRYTNEHLRVARRESVYIMSLLGSAYTAQGYSLMKASEGKKKTSRVAKSILDKAEDILRKCVTACLEIDYINFGNVTAKELFSMKTVVSSHMCNSLNSLGIMLKLKGSLSKGKERVTAWEEAEICYRKCLQSRCERVGCDHESVIKVLYNLHELYDVQGRGMAGYAQGVRNVILVCKGVVIGESGEVEKLEENLEGYNPSSVLEMMLAKVNDLKEGAMTIEEMEERDKDMRLLIDTMAKREAFPEASKEIAEAAGLQVVTDQDWDKVFDAEMTPAKKAMTPADFVEKYQDDPVMKRVMEMDLSDPEKFNQ
jgi:tetratricopeptide (TPR) repeat protein